MNLQTALKAIKTQEFPWNKVKIMLILHSSSNIYVDKYNVISTCKVWITACFLPPTHSPSLVSLVSYCSFFIISYKLLPILTSGCDLRSPLFLYSSYHHEFFPLFHVLLWKTMSPHHQRTMYNSNYKVQQIKFSIFFHWLRGFGMVDYKTLHERHYNWVSFSQDFLNWHSKHALLLTT